MRLTATLFFLLAVFNLFAQEDSPMDPLLNTDSESTNIVVPLYTIALDNISIPITLEYNNSGIKTTEIPGVVGLSWKLSDIGKITRTLNHMPDEYKNTPEQITEITNASSPSLSGEIQYANGWFFSKRNDPFGHIGFYYSPLSLDPNGFSKAHFIKKHIDTAPDFFHISNAGGVDAIFLFKKNFLGTTLLNPLPVFLTKNTQLKIDTYFDKFNYGVSNYTDIVFKTTQENGTVFEYIGGPNKQTITRETNEYYYQFKDYYVKKIKFNTNTDVINIDYIENLTQRYEAIMLAKSFNRPINTSATLITEDDSFASNATLEVSEINTPKEIIKFFYVDKPNAFGSGNAVQNVKQLTEIQILNKSGEYVTGFSFDYVSRSGGRFLLSDIYRYNNTKTNKILVRSFEYYPDSPNLATSNDVDVFGYSNENANMHSLPFSLWGACPDSPSPDPPANRSPDENWLMYTGMLHKVTNNMGGYTTYTYKLKADNINYGGGLVVATIQETTSSGEHKTTRFSYEDLRGFVLPLTNYHPYFMKVFNSEYVNYSDKPYFLSDTDHIDLVSSEFNFNQTQVFGNYFAKVIKRTNLKKPVPGQPEDLITTVYEMQPCYEGLIRRPLLKKKTIMQELYYSESNSQTTTLSEEIHTYNLLSTERVDGSKISMTYLIPMVRCHESNGAVQINIDRYPISMIQQPLISTVLKEYRKSNLGSTQDIVETHTQYKYIGDTPSPFAFDKLRQKKILTHKNNILKGIKTFTYLFEIFENYPNAGLSGLSAFNSQNFSLLCETSDWVGDVEQQLVMLKEANFIQYYNDGKIKETSKTHKNYSTNKFYSEFDFAPTYVSGALTGVSRENKIIYSYDSVNGRLLLTEDKEKLTFEAYSRANDKDPYSVNSSLNGSLLLNQTSFYRNSFEGNQPTTNITVDNNAYTGKKVYTGATFNAGSFPSGYEVSYWFYKDLKWQQNTSIHASGNVVITKPSGALYIDEVQVKPQKTVLNGVTHNPGIGINDVIDDNGFVSKNTYNPFGRIIKKTDQDQNLTEKIEYNFIQE